MNSHVQYRRRVSGLALTVLLVAAGGVGLAMTCRAFHLLMAQVPIVDLRL